MKKLFVLFLTLNLIMLCGCTVNKEKSETFFYFDTVVTITAECDSEILDGAFELCKYYDNLLSRTNESSDVYRLNHTEGFSEVSGETAYLIKRAIYFSKITEGLFDITVCPVSDLYDFNNEKAPTEDELKEAVKKVDYSRIFVDGNKVDLNGTMIDLGGIAKGYICDKVTEYLKSKGVRNATVNMGGNIKVIGKDGDIGIKKPFSQTDEILTKLEVRNTSVVTSGIYERCFVKDGVFYHHIFDTETGLPASSDIVSATVVCDSSLDADVLATICVLLGKEKATELIESIDGAEAIFVSEDFTTESTNGLYFSVDTYLPVNS